MPNFSGPYSREIEYLDEIADILFGEDELKDIGGDRRLYALQRLKEFIKGEGSGKYKNIQADWNAESDSQAAILNKPEGIPVDPNYVHTDENFTAQHRNKLENIEEMAQHNVQADWGETDTESDAYIKNVPDDIVQDGNYVHTDFNFDEHYKDMLDYHVITDDMYTSEDAEKLANIEEYATHTDIDDEITEDSTNPVESRVIFAALETKVDKEEGYGLSKNDLTDELKAKLDAIEPEANKTIVDDALSDESTNPVENRVVQAAFDTKVDKVEGQGLSDQNFTRTEKLKLEAIEEQANRTIPDETITANSRNVVESKAIYEGLAGKVDKINGKGLSTNDYTDQEKNKLAGIEENATNTIVDPQISNVSQNPVTSKAIYDAMQTKVDKVEGKGLSDNNYTDEEKIKLANVDLGAPKITIARLVASQTNGDPDTLNLTWKQCKDAISNGILYCQSASGNSSSATFCYSVEAELKNGVIVYRAEFASFNDETYEFFESHSEDAYPVLVNRETIQPDLTGKVDKTTKINGYTLDRDVEITPNDISYAHTTDFDAGTVGHAMNHMRATKADKAITVNGHSLENDVTVTASDISFEAEGSYEDGSIGKQVKELVENSENLGETKVDKTTTVNGYTLDQNVDIGSNDIAHDPEANYDSGTVGYSLRSLHDTDENLENTKADKATTVNGHLLEQNVVVGSNDITYDSAEGYDNGTVGAELKALGETDESLESRKADKTTTVNGHALSADVVVGAGDIEYSSVETYTGGSVGDKLSELDKNKVDKVDGKELSANDFTDELKAKLEGIKDQATRVLVDASITKTGTNPVEGKAVYTELEKKTDRKLTSASGTALIFNESDGGGAKFEHTDGTLSYVGVNDGGKDGITGQLYSLMPVNGKNVGTRLNLTNDGFYYLPNSSSSSYTAEDELATIRDVQNSIVFPSDSEPLVNGTAGSGSSALYSREDHVHPTDETRASVESPDFTGTPTAPTAEKGTDSKQIATTAFVQTAISDKANAEDVYTKDEVDNKLTAIYHLKGTKDTVSDLPTKSNKTGDVWHIAEDGSEYFWTGSAWEEFGTLVDLTGYVYDTEYVHTDNNLTGDLKSKLDGIEAEANKTVVDSSVSSSSENPVQSKAIYTELGKKTDRLVTGGNGRALIFNEDDGGGAKFEHSDGTMSFVGVNNGGAEGITGQLYSVKKVGSKNVGTRLNITTDGFFYLPNSNSAAYTAGDEIATHDFVESAVSDKADASSVYTKEEIDEKFEAVPQQKGAVEDISDLPETGNSVGDIWYVSGKSKAYEWNGTSWVVSEATTGLEGYAFDPNYVHTDNNFTDESVEKLSGIESEANKTVVDSAITSGSENPVQSKAIYTELEKKTDRTLTGPNGRALMFNEDDGGGAKFEHSDGTWSFVGVNDGGDGGITGQIYSIKKVDNKYVGTRLNMTTAGFYYTTNANSAAYTANDEIATHGFVQNALDGKADANDVYTKEEIDQKLTSLYEIKGTKEEVTDLPTEGNTTGDVWHVNADGKDYIWNGSDWELFEGVADLSGYVYDPDYVHTDNNLTDELKTKLESIDVGSLANVQADWSAASGDAQILNKPMINNVELVGGNNSLESLGIAIATEQNIDDLFN